MHPGMNALKIGLICGDGIGKEVIPAARRVLEASATHPNRFNFVCLDAGFETFQRTGTALPKETVAKLKECDGALFGAVSSPIHKVNGYSSPIVQLRKDLHLYANVRPVSAKSVFTPSGEQVPCDVLIVRENTECLYVKDEHVSTGKDGKVAIARRVITERATRLIAKVAFDMALERHRAREANPQGHWWLPRQPHVTIVHKSNVLSITDGLFREIVYDVHRSNSKYASVEVDDQLVDSMIYRVIREPNAFDVCLCPNLYGDILSDAAAGLAGSLGVVPSANVGDHFVMGEPVHGSAPDIAGQGIANPIAAIRSAALLLSHLGETGGSAQINSAVDRAICSGLVTKDLGGPCKADEVIKAIISFL